MKFNLILIAIVISATVSHADRPAVWNAKACGLAGTPSSVTIDVYDDTAPGSVLATILNADVSQLGITDCFVADLTATVAAISFPSVSSVADRSYTLMWDDDVLTDPIVTSEVVIGLTGAARIDLSCVSETPIYATVLVPSRGIDASIIAKNRPSYTRLDYSCSKNFGAPDATFYNVYHYDGFGRVLKREPSDTVPSP